MKSETLAIHGGFAGDSVTGASVAPICQTVSYAYGTAQELADAASDHFMMEPTEQFAVVKDIRSEGLEMLAIYHSHPESPPRPSAEDIRLALTPGVIYAIVSLLDNDAVVNGFLMDGGHVTEVPVTIGRRPE